MLQQLTTQHTFEHVNFTIPQPFERREHERVNVSLDVRMRSLTTVNHPGRVTDISLGGCYITSLLPLKEGEKLLIEILSPTGNWLKFPVEVAHWDRGIGFGVKFTHLTSEKYLLEALIEFARQD
jgi:hypothetical protein